MLLYCIDNQCNTPPYANKCPKLLHASLYCCNFVAKFQNYHVVKK